MAFTTRLANVRDHREHFNERPWMCYHQVPPLVRVVAHVGDARQAKSHLEHNPLSLLRTCHAIPLRKLNDPGGGQDQLVGDIPSLLYLCELPQLSLVVVRRMTVLGY